MFNIDAQFRSLLSDEEEWRAWKEYKTKMGEDFTAYESVNISRPLTETRSARGGNRLKVMSVTKKRSRERRQIFRNQGMHLQSGQETNRYNE